MNRILQQEFLNLVKEFQLSNPDKTITQNFIYSLLTRFNIKNNTPLYDITNIFFSLKDYYKENININVFETDALKDFLILENGNLSPNPIKLYIPLDVYHVENGSKILFNFISQKGITHQSKIARYTRNDNVVIRVNNIEDANTIIDFVKSNEYLKEGLENINPFLPNNNGVGMFMDNTLKHSFNGYVCEIISNYLNYLKNLNRLDLFTIDGLNNYIKEISKNITDLDELDIYNLISMTTSNNFEISKLYQHINNKLSDLYDENSKRIIDPKYYLEKVINLTYQKYPQNPKEAIKSYLKGDSKYFTNEEHSKEGLIKYVNPGNLINIMRSKLSEVGISIPHTDDELIDKYLTLILKEEIINDVSINILKEAYILTQTKYSKEQARLALKVLISSNSPAYFTNDNKSRDKIINNILGKDIKKLILQDSDLDNIDINNIDSIIETFENSLNIDNKDYIK